MENKKWTTQRLVQFFAFLLLIVVLPGGSWYYLRSGLNKRLESKADLHDFGKIMPFSLQNQKGEPVTERSLVGKIALFSFPKKGATTSVFDSEKSLAAQYEARSDIHFFSVVADSVAAAKALSDGLREPKHRRIWSHLADPSHVFSNQFLEKATQNGHLTAPENLIALVDTTGSIRRFYDATDRAEMVKMVYQIGLMLPSRE